MKENSKYYHILDSDDKFIIDDRLEINRNEILIYFITLLIAFLFLSDFNLIIAVPLSILFSLFYISFRYFAWFKYSELSIDKLNASVKKVNKLFNKTKSVELLDKAYDFSKIEFDKHERSGKTKYVLKYKTHKSYEILVIKSNEDRLVIEQALKNIKTMPNNI